jgi:hypothetical protein
MIVDGVVQSNGQHYDYQTTGKKPPRRSQKKEL